MKLYLIRHAIAEERAPSGRDADRALTDEGRSKMRRAAEGLRMLGVRLDLLLTSPYRRAVETAEIVVAVLGSVDPQELPALASGAPLERALAAVRKARGREAVGLVGHQPDLGFLASQVLTGSPETCPLPFKKGAVACFEIDETRTGVRASLDWFLTPRQLRMIAGGRE